MTATAPPAPVLHFASLFEAFADELPDDLAVASGPLHLGWRDFDDAAARFAGFLRSLGVGRDAKVAIYLYNSADYLIAHYGAMKERAIPINVNYRYLDDELAYLVDDADAEVLVYHASLAERVQRVRGRLPKVKAYVEVDDLGPGWGARQADATPTDGSYAWAAVLAGHDPARRIARGADDLYLFYTGGTTGMPKGVMYRHEDLVMRFGLAGYRYRGWEPPADGVDFVPLAKRHRESGARLVSIPACPLMHATGLWVGCLCTQLIGGAAVTVPGRHFDPAALWRTAQDERADIVVIVGDAFARPMLAELDAAEERGEPYRLDDLRVIISSGVMWSAEVQRGLLRHLDVRLVDGLGSTEVSLARRVVTRADPIETARFEPMATTKVIDEDGREVLPGSGGRGRIAGAAWVPLGYYKDPVKSAATFPTIDGVRYAVIGDWATVENDGTVVLLGRGSNCINTAGEKVFPEEVEEAVKTHPAVADCLVVGVADERFGERVVAVAALAPGASASEQQLIEHAKSRLAHYKAPRRIAIVDEVRRAANGKADYTWAKETARAT